MSSMLLKRIIAALAAAWLCIAAPAYADPAASFALLPIVTVTATTSQDGDGLLTLGFQNAGAPIDLTGIAFALQWHPVGAGGAPNTAITALSAGQYLANGGPSGVLSFVVPQARLRVLPAGTYVASLVAAYNGHVADIGLITFTHAALGPSLVTSLQTTPRNAATGNSVGYIPGPQGLSAYQVAVAAGFAGTQAQWLATLVGPLGATGPQGPQGIPGATGATGPQGPVGATGAQGPQGQTGPIGPTGPQGTTGATGAQGTTGATGSMGATGAVGPQPWATPPAAWAASTSYSAAAPASVTTYGGSSYVCATSHTSGASFDPSKWTLIASIGAAGPTGPQGATGSQGAQGATGATGAAGVNGATMLTTSGAPSASTGNNGDYANDPSAQVMYGPKASGSWPAGIGYKGATGSTGATGAQGPASSPNVFGFAGLKITNGSTPNSQVAVSWSGINLVGVSQGQPITAGSATISTGGTGANGLDTGTVALNTWYAVWVISNGSATAGLLSTSATAPTMPSGYTYKGRVGWVRTDGSGNLLRALQVGRRAQYVITGDTNNTTSPIAATATSQVGDQNGTWVAVSVINYVPPTAVIIFGNLYGSDIVVGIAPNQNYGGYQSSTNPPSSEVYTAYSMTTPFSFVLESSNIYWFASAESGYPASIVIRGWEDNL